MPLHLHLEAFYFTKISHLMIKINVKYSVIQNYYIKNTVKKTPKQRKINHR